MSYRKNQGIKLLIIILFTAALVSVISQKAWASPDVHVTDIQTPSSLIAGQYFSIRVDMINYGSAGDFSLSMYIDGSEIGAWQLYIQDAGWGLLFGVTISGLSAGYHVITFCANTCLSKGWTWTGGTSDLELSDIYPPTSLNALEQTTIAARISNIGSGDAGYHYIAVLVDGSYAGSLRVDPLPAG